MNRRIKNKDKNTCMKPDKIKFDLINNAKDSLIHAVEHLTNPNRIKARDLKCAIRDVVHVVELLLKERLRRVHPSFIWQDIDKYPSSTTYIIGISRSVERLCKLAGVSFAKDSKKTISACKTIRNSIEHYEFQLDFKKTKGIIGRMLSFIFDFSKRHLELDLEKEFRSDTRWDELINLYEFWEAHSTTLEKQLSEQKKPVCNCPSCGAVTYDISESKCLLCGNTEELVECDECHNMVNELETKTFDEVNGDPESGVCGSYSLTICQNCIDRHIAEDMAIDSMKEE